MRMELELQSFLLIPHRWTLSSSQLLFLLNILEFCLGHVNLRKCQKTWRMSMKIFILLLCSFFSFSVLFLKLQPFWLHQIYPFFLQLVRWAPSAWDLSLAPQVWKLPSENKWGKCGACLCACLFSRIVNPQVLLSWLCFNAFKQLLYALCLVLIVIACRRLSSIQKKPLHY